MNSIQFDDNESFFLRQLTLYTDGEISCMIISSIYGRIEESIWSRPYNALQLLNTST